MPLEKFNYIHNKQDFHLYVASPAKTAGKSPAVLIFPDWSGCNDFAKQKAEKLAALGYVGIAVDLYGDGRLGETTEEKKALIQPLLNDRGLLRQRLHAAYEKALTLNHVDSQRIAAMGFCFGGLCALDIARSGAALKGVVSFHGLLNAPDALAQAPIKAKILALHGYADPMVTPTQVNTFAEEMEKAHVDWQLHMYGQTLHAFTNPQANDASFGTVYNATADKRAWQAMQDFFNEVLA